MNENGPAVVVAIPNLGWIHKTIAATAILFQADSRYKCKFNWHSSVPGDSARNLIVKAFLEDEENEYLFFLDADNPPLDPNLKNPLDLIDLDKDIMVLPTLMWKGTREKQQMGHWPLMWNTMVKVGTAWAQNPHHGGLREIDAGGSGGIIIARRVLEKVKPAFVRGWDDDGIATVGSDFLFCDRAKQLGFTVWTHYDYPCSHYKERDLTEIWHYMSIRDLSQMTGRPNVNTEEHWDKAWSERPERILKLYERVVKECDGRGRIMDFGCGRGDLLNMLRNAGRNAFGVDQSSKAVDIVTGRGMLAYQGTEPREYGKVDVIVCTEVIEHLDDDKGMLEKFFEVADKVIWSVPNNCLPPMIEPEHRRVYDHEYAHSICPHFKEMVDYGDYLLIIAEKEAQPAEVREHVEASA